MLDNNVYTGIIVGTSAIITKVLSMWEKQRDAATADRRRAEEREDRRRVAEEVKAQAATKAAVIFDAVAAQKAQVLGAIKENTAETRAGVQASKEAFFEVNGNAAKFAEIHRMLVTMKADFEKERDEYTHPAIHLIRNRLALLTMRPDDPQQPPDDYDDVAPGIQADPHGGPGRL